MQKIAAAFLATPYGSRVSVLYLGRIIADRREYGNYSGTVTTNLTTWRKATMPDRPTTNQHSIQLLGLLVAFCSLAVLAVWAVSAEDSSAMEMIWIEPGTFLMGSPVDEPDRRAHLEQQHQVTLARGFWLGKNEVTQKQWQSVMGDNPAKIKGDNNPVEQVSWLECVVFCNALSEKEGLTPAYHVLGDTVTWDQATDGYRLPTEAEWEYACRAGTTGPRAGDLDDTAIYAKNSGRKTRPVGGREPNPWGLHDMYGNVWEWCWDKFGGNYGPDPVTDPTGPEGDLHRIQRGGSWHRNPRDCRSASRNTDHEGTRRNGLGFRVARWEAKGL